MDASRPTDPRMVELPPEQCLALLGSVPIGRVGVTIDALPAVLPVNFSLWNGSIVFRTVPGTKLDAAAAGEVVAFEADAYGSQGAPGGWSVLVRGIAREITDPRQLAEVGALPLDSWAWDGQAHRYVCIEPTVITGRRIVTA